VTVDRGASSGSSPRASATPETRSAFANLASRFSGGGGGSKDRTISSSSSNGSSPVSAASKWGNLAGGFLGLQSSNNGVVGSGRLIPRGWVQFGQHQHKGSDGGTAAATAAAAAAASAQGADADACADAFAVGAAVGAEGQQQQHPDQVSGSVEPATPGKGAAAAAAAGVPAAAAGVLLAAAGGGREPGVLHEKGSVAGGGVVGGFEGEEPEWSSANSNICYPKDAGQVAM
jgi:hypothetical protein